MSELYHVKVLTPSHSLHFKNREVRTPVEFSDITENDLIFLKSQIKAQDLKAEISLKNKEKKVEKVELDFSNDEYRINEDKEVVIEDLTPLDDGPKSILDTLLENDD